MAFLAIWPYFVSAQAPTNGLVAYYPFNGNATDVSGNTNHGYVIGATLTTDHRGIPNGAYRFSEGTRITIPNRASLQFTNAYSFSGWFRLRSLQGRDGYTGQPVELGSHVLFSKDCDREWLYAMIIPITSRTLMLSGGTWGGWLSTYFDYSSDIWIHYSQVYDGRQMLLYLNGRLKASSLTKNDFTLSNSADLIIGGMNCWSYYFNGDLDDLRFYNRALTDAEVQAIYTAENGPIHSVKAGNWTDPTTWSCSCIPTISNPVLVQNVVTVPATLTVYAQRVTYSLGGRVVLQNEAKLQLAE